MALDWLGFGGSLAGGLIDSFTHRSINRQNIAFARETMDRNEGLMRESWAREDNAVQRRRADLEAAGLSPLLAAGSAAQASGGVQHAPPKKDQREAIALQSMMAALQARLTQAEVDKVKAETGAIRFQNMRDRQDYNHREIMNKIEQDLTNQKLIDLVHNYQESRKSGLRTTDQQDVWFRRLQQFLTEEGEDGSRQPNALMNFIDRLIGTPHLDIQERTPEEIERQRNLINMVWRIITRGGSLSGRLTGR